MHPFLFLSLFSLLSTLQQANQSPSQVCFTDDRWRRNLERPARKCQREARCGQRSLGKGLLGCGKQGNDLPHDRRRKLDEDPCADAGRLDGG